MAENYTDSLVFTKNLDENGTPFIPKLVEVAVIADNGRVQCKQNVYKKNGISIISPEGLKRVSKIEYLLTTTSSYYIYEDRGEVVFSDDLIGEVVAFEYYGTGNANIGDCRVFTTVDNNGNITETLNDIVEEGRNVLDTLKTLGEGVVILNKIEEVVQNAETLNSALGIKISIGDQLSTKLEGTIQTGNNTNSTLSATIQTGNSTNTTLNATIKNADSKNTTLNQTIANADSKNTTLNSTINTATSKNTTLTSTISTADSKNTTLNATISTATSKDSTLKTTISNADTKNSTLNTTIGNADTRNTTLNQTIDKANTKDTDLKASITKGENLNTTLTSTISTADSKNSTLTSTINTATSKNTTLTQTIDSATSKNSTLSQTVSNADSKNTTLGQTITTANSKNSTLNATIASADSKNTTLNNTINTATSKNTTLNATISTGDSLNTKLTTSINTADSKNTTLNNSITVANKTLESLESQTGQIQQSDNKIYQIRSTDWKLNAEKKMYEFMVKHDMGKTSLLFEYQSIRNGKKCGYFLDYEIQDENNVKFITESADEVFIIISARYFTGVGVDESLLEVDKMVDGTNKVIMTRQERELLKSIAKTLNLL